MSWSWPSSAMSRSVNGWNASTRSKQSASVSKRPSSKRPSAWRARHLALLLTVLDHLPGGAYLVQGSDATLVLANRAATDVWGTTWPPGVSMAEFLRASGVHFVTEGDKPVPLDALVTVQVARGGPPMRQQREVVHRSNGSLLPILLSAVAIEPLFEGDRATDDAERAALILVQDISELDALERLKDQFITVAAHELRTPLAAIQGYASMLTVQTQLGRGPELADWQQEAIDELEEASGRMNEIVSDLLEATRIQAGKLELHPVLVDVVAAVRQSLARLQLSTCRHTLTLAAPDASVLVEADRSRLEQILGNLVGHAIKYSPQGGPVSLHVQVDLQAGVAEIHVQDNGIGIPADQQARLFGRFVRASNVHDHNIPGSGLGLYVCRELVERHGGQIWFESTEGVGTTFFLTLPLAALPMETSAVTQPDPGGAR
jgi:signal transduction histidine kinase